MRLVSTVDGTFMTIEIVGSLLKYPNEGLLNLDLCGYLRFKWVITEVSRLICKVIVTKRNHTCFCAMHKCMRPGNFRIWAPGST